MPDIEGVPYEATGGKLDQATAQALAARHREAASAGVGAASAAGASALSSAKAYTDAYVRSTAESARRAADDAARAESAAARAADDLADFDPRFTALEAAAGFGPSTPEDGQTAALVLGGTLTADAVASRMSQVTGTVTDAGAQSLQAVVDAARPGDTVLVTREWSLAAPLVVSKPLTLRGVRGGRIVVTDKGQHGVSVTADDVTLDALRIKGAGGSVQGVQRLVDVQGASTTAPARRFTMRGCHLTDASYIGVWVENAEAFTITGTTLEDNAYAGIMVMSSRFGMIDGCRVRRILQPGTLVNSYGISMSRWSNKTLEEAPHTTDVVVRGNLVESVPRWEGIDTHGGQRLTITGNTVLDCMIGIAMVPCLDKAGVIRYAPKDVQVVGNIVDSRGEARGKRAGVQLVGTVNTIGDVIEYATGIITGNVITGHGDTASGTQGGIYLKATRGAVVSGNTIVRPAPSGIVLHHDNDGFVASGNTIVDAWSDGSFSASVHVPSNHNRGAVTGSLAVAAGRTAAKVNDRGLFISSSVDAGTCSIRLDANDFTVCTLPLIDSPATQNITWTHVQARKLSLHPNATPIPQQTGVPKTVDGIHAALVKLGVITS